MSLVFNQTLLFFTSLEFVSFNYIPQEWNKATDYLAKWVFDHVQDWNIMDREKLPLDLSHDLDDIVSQDRAPC